MIQSTPTDQPAQQGPSPEAEDDAVWETNVRRIDTTSDLYVMLSVATNSDRASGPCGRL